MNKKLTFCALLLGCCVAFTVFTACGDDNDESPVAPNAALEKAFSDRYPEAGRPLWETKGTMAVAEFSIGGYEADAWFDTSGQWVLTETDVPFAALPEAVRKGVAESPYADWKVEDVDKLERPEAATVYRIEVEKGETEKDLYYDENGMLFKEVTDEQGENGTTPPAQLPQAAKSRIEALYPGAVILEYEVEKQGLEVDIVHDKRYKEVVFSADGASWLFTEWDLAEAELPAAVKTALQTPDYANWRIDDIDCIEKPTGVFFKIELEQGNRDREVMFGEDGVVVI